MFTNVQSYFKESLPFFFISILFGCQSPSKTMPAQTVTKLGLQTPQNLLAAKVQTRLEGPFVQEKPSTQERPFLKVPYTPGLDISSLDQTINPCEDFYRYSCGGWMKKNPIPADKAFWNVYAKLTEENLQYLWGLVQTAADSGLERTPIQKKVGDFFASCMDENYIEKVGLSPLQSYLDQIEQIQSLSDLSQVAGKLHLIGINMFGFSSSVNIHSSSTMIATASAGGLGLPDRSYYVETDPKSQATRARYLLHIQKILELSQMKSLDAQKAAQDIVRIENALAMASLTRTQKQDPKRLDHQMTVVELQKAMPAFYWDLFLKAVEAPPVPHLQVTEPLFFHKLNELLTQESLSSWKSYCRWHLLRVYSPYLSSAFTKEHFSFYKEHLRGIQKMTPRWKKCLWRIDEDLGEALGQLYVENTSSLQTKERATYLVKKIQQVMENRLKQISWMTEKTKTEALKKLKSMRNKIGYPKVWRDYSSLLIERNDFVGNVTRAIHFESKRDLQSIGKSVDLEEWSMTPYTVDAYYDFHKNEMNFPLGVLQPPLFDLHLDSAPLFGNTGSTIGHELIHGFDDKGRQFDSNGNLRNWWTSLDEKEFQKKAQCIQDQYAQYVVIDHIKVNSQLTLGEDIADLAGLVLAYEAWKEEVKDQHLEPIDGLTPAQRFFIGYAQWDCANEREESLRFQSRTSTHSPHQYRINGVVANMPEFQQAFSCKAGQPMVNQNICQIW